MPKSQTETVQSMAQKNLQEWKNRIKSAPMQRRLNLIGQNSQAVLTAFGGELEFGTAGMRAPMGTGTNLLNVYTVSKATRGAARFLKLQAGAGAAAQNLRVAVSYDSRINSKKFARIAAAAFADEGFSVYLTRTLRPTPFLSYLVRQLNCAAGVMITASHNSSEYNGYKLYDETGTQINEQTASGVLEQISKVDIFTSVSTNFFKHLLRGRIKFTSRRLLNSYMLDVLSCSVIEKEKNAQIKIAYSALCGTGYRLVPRALKGCGVKNIVFTPTQCRPDGHFTTCPAPNPEKLAALEQGINCARKNCADILIATDPDCDRVGVAAFHGGEYVHLSGQQIGALFSAFLLKQKRLNGTLPTRPVVIKSIVTSRIIEKITQSFGGECINLLTGFKYIGEAMCRMEKGGRSGDFVLGLEESCGYLASMHVRDKDGVQAAMLIAQMCAEAKSRGKTLIDELDALYAEYGAFKHSQITFRFDGADGAQRMAQAMGNVRVQNNKSLGGAAVVETTDLLKRGLGGIKSNVVIFDLENEAQAIVRPSGTEPLVKIYLTARDEEIFAPIAADIEKMFFQSTAKGGVF